MSDGSNPEEKTNQQGGPTGRRRVASAGVMVGLALVAGVIVWQRSAIREGLARAIVALAPDPTGSSLGPSVTGQTLIPAQYGRSGGFDLRSAVIPVNEIFAGGPPKDGIPALSDPEMLPADAARYLQPTDRVAGVALGGEARAYPLRILTQHEIVNDTVGKVPVAVTYCPLCDSVAVFDRRTALGLREFGVSGLLYNSNVLMYDRGGRPESLWSQMAGAGVSGPAGRVVLKTLPVDLTTWQDWVRRHPETKVLSTRTGHGRDYTRNPYRAYFATGRLMFPVRRTDRRLPPKTPVLGIWVEHQAKAYPVSVFGRQARTVQQQLGGKRLTIAFDPEAQSLRVVKADEGVEWVYAFWFAWYAFRPQTALFTGRELAARK